MWINLPSAVNTALLKLNSAGYEAYVVGGCVRDSLMGHIPDDWDITTSATPQEMQAVFADYRTIETGVQHGTLSVIIEGMPLEITTFRIEGTYSDGRHPDSVAFSRELSEDLQRRDFTINAMAYHPQSGLVDLFDGQTDLANGMIRCVGDPPTRFKEDSLRIIRALRFAAVLDFDIDNETDASLRRLSPTLARVSAERIAAELCKLLCGRAVYRVVSEYAVVLTNVIPELADIKDFHLLSAVEPTPIPRLAALLWKGDISDETVERMLRRLRLDNHTVQSVKRLLMCKGMPCCEKKHLLQLLNRLDVDLIWHYLALCEANAAVLSEVERLLAENCCYQVSMLDVDGNDVMDAGICNGPDVGQALHRLLEAVMDDQCPNHKHDLLMYLKTIKKPVQ